MVEKGKELTEEEYKKWLSSHDKTKTINEEAKGTSRDKHDFVKFCKYRWNLKKVRPGSLKINEDENGEKYASIQVKAGDCPEINEDTGAIETERNELWLSKECDFKFNENLKYKFSFKIPKKFPLSPTRLVIGQRKYNKINDDEVGAPSPILAQRIKKIDGKYYFVITDGTEQKNILGKIPFDDIKGKWVDMEYELKFSDKTDKNGKPIPCIAKIKANVEGKMKIDEEEKFYLEEKNNLQFNPTESHSGYFKFGLYRDNYDYALTKDFSEEDKKEIEKAQKTDEENPMEIYFKNFSMENLSYQDREQERNESKQIDGSQIEQKKSELLEDKQENEILNESDDSIRKSYVDTFLSLVGDNKNLSKIVESLKNGEKMELTTKDIENIYNELNNIYQKSKKDFVDQKVKGGINKDNAKDEFRALSKFCMDPKMIEKFKTFNCSGASLMMASITKSLGGKAYVVSIYHHSVCIAEIENKLYMIDTINGGMEDITNKIEITNTEYNQIKSFTSKEPILGQFTKGYIYENISQAEKNIHAGNYISLNDKKYHDIHEEITKVVSKEKINSYPKYGDPNFPYFTINDNFPDFDRKIYSKQQTPGQINILGKIKHNIGELFTKLKKYFLGKK